MKLSEIQKIGSRGVLFIYEFGDSVYLINALDKIILCDTSEGKAEMGYVKDYLKDQNLLDKPLFIFNSHSDWDHIWGNEAFPDAYIIGHNYCRKRMMEKGEFDLTVFSRDDINLKYPNITFSDQLIFADDDIEFIYTPGHTICSATCVDHLDNVCYVGDLIEYPLPFLNATNLEDYIKSLRFIKELQVNTIITTHSKIVSESLIDEHIHYLYDVLSGKYLTFTNEFSPIRHLINLKNLLVLEYEDVMKNKLVDKFDYQQYKLNLWNFIRTKHGYQNKRIFDLRELSYQELKDDLEEFHG